MRPGGRPPHVHTSLSGSRNDEGSLDFATAGSTPPPPADTLSLGSLRDARVAKPRKTRASDSCWQFSPGRQTLNLGPTPPPVWGQCWCGPEPSPLNAYRLPNPVTRQDADCQTHGRRWAGGQGMGACAESGLGVQIPRPLQQPDLGSGSLRICSLSTCSYRNYWTYGGSALTSQTSPYKSQQLRRGTSALLSSGHFGNEGVGQTGLPN